MLDLTATPAFRLSAIYIAILVIGLVPLAIMVIRLRRGNRIGIGDGGNQQLARAIRVHGNYAENAPFGMILLIMLALLGAATWVIHAVGLAMIAGRAAHAYGLSKTSGASMGRVMGMVLTQTSLLMGGLALLWTALA